MTALLSMRDKSTADSENTTQGESKVKSDYSSVPSVLSMRDRFTVNRSPYGLAHSPLPEQKQGSILLSMRYKRVSTKLSFDWAVAFTSPYGLVADYVA